VQAEHIKRFAILLSNQH